MGLNGQVSLIEFRIGECYLTGNELGRTTRSARNLCDPVSEALSVTNMRDIVFGDIHPVRKTTMEIPDPVIVKLVSLKQPSRETTVLVLVVKLRTY